MMRITKNAGTGVTLRPPRPRSAMTPPLSFNAHPGLSSIVTRARSLAIARPCYRTHPAGKRQSLNR